MSHSSIEYLSSAVERNLQISGHKSRLEAMEEIKVRNLRICHQIDS